MKRMIISTIVLLVALPAVLQAEAIKISLSDIDKAVQSIPQPKNISSVVQVVPIEASIPSSYDNSLKTSYSSPKTQKEEVRDAYIKAIRDVIERGQDFKYLFYGYDYQSAKRDLERMMRDAVSE